MPSLNQLNRAIRGGDLDRALAMIEPGHWLDENDNDIGDTALCAAVAAKADVVVGALLKAGAKVEARSRHGEMPLHRACQLGHEAIARALIDAGADVNAKTPTNANSIDGGQTVLIKAVMGQKLPLIKLLIENGADPSAKDDCGFTPLRHAQHGAKRIADYLAKTMAATTDQMELSIFDAVRARALSRLQALASHGGRLDECESEADLTPLSGLTPLHLAAEGAWMAGVEFLLKRGVSADVRSRHQLTPLMVVGTGKEALDVARALLQAGADSNAKSPDGRSALGQVTEVGLAKLLLEAGADPNLRDPNTGHTVFLSACLLAGPDILGAMIDAGADLKAVDNSGRGLEFYAKSNSRARALINDRLGAPISPADRLREALKALPQLAMSEPFLAYAGNLGNAFNQKPAAWKKRKGALYFHNVSLARVYAYFGAAMPRSDDKSSHDAILAHLAVDARRAGATLFHLEQVDDPERKPFVLLPIAEPLAPAICCGTNANLLGDTNQVVEALLKIAADDPFDIYGCGVDFIDAQLRDKPKDALALAERLIKVCPDLANRSDIPGSTRSLARELADTGRFRFWWD